MLKQILCYGAACYAADALVRPHLVAKRARAFADAAGKPLVNMGAGTPQSSLRVKLFGPTLWGDVNYDIAERHQGEWANRVTFGNAYSIPAGDKEYGALTASHVLEHLDDPDRALDEWDRVAERLFIIVPWWWTPHGFAYDDHQWIYAGGKAIRHPLFARQQAVQPKRWRVTNGPLEATCERCA